MKHVDFVLNLLSIILLLVFSLYATLTHQNVTQHSSTKANHRYSASHLHLLCQRLAWGHNHSALGSHVAGQVEREKASDSEKEGERGAWCFA